MAIYLDIYNLIINKKAITEKYIDGLERFREDYIIQSSEINHEDGQLFSLGQMNADEFDIDKLVQNGLNYDHDLRYSDDFTIVCRYQDAFWEVDWLEHNNVFAWHIDSDSQEVQLAKEVLNMPMYRIAELIDQGKILLKLYGLRIYENHI
ncbi:MAG: hypothetical protein IPH57_08480 [Saprospiraceae bacterium]|nr:hypothetical protein [Saprospiraceae bacterium]